MDFAINSKSPKLSIDTSICLPVFLSVYLFICLLIYLSFNLFICLSVNLFICLSICESASLSSRLSKCLIWYLSICSFTHLFIWLCLFVYPSVYPCKHSNYFLPKSFTWNFWFLQLHVDRPGPRGVGRGRRVHLPERFRARQAHVPDGFPNDLTNRLQESVAELGGAGKKA